jgi:hypothetical protein
MEEMQYRAESVEPGEPGTVVRLLREIVNTPAFVEVIKTNLGTFDEESARQLVRTLMKEDPELSVTVAATFPQIVNYLAAAVAEFGQQLDNLPEGLGDQYLEEFTLGIDSARFQEIAEVYRSFVDRIDLKHTAISAFGRSVNALASAINSTAAKNPYFLRDALTEVDGMQVARAFLAVAGSAFLCLVSRIMRLFIRS